jgi:hypothetical protein
VSSSGDTMYIVCFVHHLCAAQVLFKLWGEQGNKNRFTAKRPKLHHSRDPVSIVLEWQAGATMDRPTRWQRTVGTAGLSAHPLPPEYSPIGERKHMGHSMSYPVFVYHFGVNLAVRALHMM